nr:hypothetical protein [Tanacetum cinerariifolium]
ETNVPTGSGFIPTAGPPATLVSTGSEVGPTASPTVRRRKGKEIMLESDTPKKKKLQEQSDAQMARELEEQQEREGLRMNEQIARDAEDIEAKFTPVWKRIDDFTPMGSKEEAERAKRQGIILEKEQVKKQKLSEEASESKTPTEEVSEDKIKEMMQLVPVEDVYVQSLQVKHPIIDWKVHSEGERNYWQIIRLGGSTACYQFFIDLLRQLDREDPNQLWSLVKEYLTTRPTLNDKEMERTRTAQSSVLPPTVDEPASPLSDVSQGEACPTDFGFGADQDRANIAKTSTLPYDSVPRVTSPDADEGREEVGCRVGWKLLSSEVAEIPTGSEFIPTVGSPAAKVPAGSDVIARDAEIVRIHVEEELQIMINGLDRSNETVAKYLQEYHQFATKLPLERRIELIRDLVRGITFEEIEAKFTTFWKQIKNFIHMGSKEEAERLKRKDSV